MFSVKVKNRKINRNMFKLGCFALILLSASFFSSLSLAEVKGFAVIVGVSEYSDRFVSDLNFCDDDAQDIYDALPASDWDEVTLLKDAEATKANILNAISNLSQVASSSDIILFFFSGHGVNETDQGNVIATYICPHDTSSTGYDNDISETELENALGELPTQNVCVILDSCQSGGFIDKGTSIGAIKTYLKVGQVPPSAEQLELVPGFKDLQESGYVVLTACREAEYSMEYAASDPQEPDNGVFSYYVIQGLSGSADENQDGVISAEEIYDYASPSATRDNPGQHAQLYDGNGAPDFNLKPFTVSGGGSDGGCFIATALYGSKMASEVKVLSDFRDSYLLRNEFGRKFVQLYYQASPSVARFIDKHPVLRKFLRIQITPFVKVASVVCYPPQSP